MKVQDFQAKINQSIVLAKRLMEETYEGSISECVQKYLDDNDIHIRKKDDLIAIVMRGALLKNEPEHKILLGVKAPEDYREPEVEELIDKYSIPDEIDDWQETLLRVRKSQCYRCGGTKRHSEYNTHDGKYCTYDTVCDECGEVILSLLD